MNSSTLRALLAGPLPVSAASTFSRFPPIAIDPACEAVLAVNRLTEPIFQPAPVLEADSRASGETRRSVPAPLLAIGRLWFTQRGHLLWLIQMGV